VATIGAPVCAEPVSPALPTPPARAKITASASSRTDRPRIGLPGPPARIRLARGPGPGAGVRAPVRSGLQPPCGTGDPGQDSPLPSARLEPLVDRHPPKRASCIQETGRHSGA
jgi:hypothetical protein